MGDDGTNWAGIIVSAPPNKSRLMRRTGLGDSSRYDTREHSQNHGKPRNKNGQACTKTTNPKNTLELNALRRLEINCKIILTH